MRLKTLVGFSIVTAAVLAVALLVSRPDETAAPESRTGFAVFPGLAEAVGTVTKIVVKGPDGTVTLLHGAAPATPSAPPDAGWTLAEKGSYPVQPASMHPLIEALTRLHATDPKTARPRLYHKIDVEGPGPHSASRSIDLYRSGDPAPLRLIVGKQRYSTTSGTNDAIYVRRPDDSQAWLARPGFELASDALSWLDTTILNLDTAQIRTILIEPAGDARVRLVRDQPGDKFRLADLPPGLTPRADDPGADSAYSFQFMALADVRAAAPLAGLTPVQTLHAETFDGLTLDLRFVAADGATWITFKPAGTGAAAKIAAAITARTAGWAYKLPDDRLKSLTLRIRDITQAAGSAPSN